MPYTSEISIFEQILISLEDLNYVSVNSKPDLPPPPPPPGDSHILVAPGVGFSLLCLAQGVLNQNKNLLILKQA